MPVGVPPPRDGNYVRMVEGEGPPPRDGISALSLLIIINLGFFAMGGGADIIVVIGFSRSYDYGLCCFIGSIIPRWGCAPNDASSAQCPTNVGHGFLAVRIDRR